LAEFFEIDKLSFSTGVNCRQITVSAGLPAGGALVVGGPSGAGKSTLLRVLARLLDCSAGEVRLGGIGWRDFPAGLWRRLVHYLAQKPALFDGTVLDNLNKPFELAAVKKDLVFDAAAANRGMEQLLLPSRLLYQDARTLSGGEAARVALLRALLLNPAVLLLDEPTAAIDEKARLAVLDVIGSWLAAEPNRGVVIVSHAGDTGCFPQLCTLNIEPVKGD
jgi:putative ABC transport system ATP-binding protein